MTQALDKQGASLASFFFRRDADDLARSRKVITTVIFQLAIPSRRFSSLIHYALWEDTSLADSTSLSQRSSKLLLRPFNGLDGAYRNHFRRGARYVLGESVRRLLES